MINFVFGCIAGFVAFGCIWRYGLYKADSDNKVLATIVPGMRYYNKDDKTFVVKVLGTNPDDTVTYTLGSGGLYHMSRRGFKLKFKVYKKTEEGHND